ncbi:MAG: murein biosynthesis integral membrane protein MurJ [Alphaproteobacteria bacterium]
MSLLRAMSTVAGLTALSRIAGFIRDILTAAILGAGPIGDAFFVALKLPNFFRRVTAEGAFSVSFVPVYSEALEQKGRDEADEFARNAFVWMLGILSVFVIIIMAAMPWVLYAIAPGFIGDEMRYDLAVELSRITFPYLLFMSLTALLGGVLNALNRFAPFAFAPVLFNLCLIAALLLNGFFETAGHALAWGILAAGMIQLVWLVICAKRQGFAFKMRRPRYDERTRRVFRLMGPGVIGAGVMHINLFADLILASFLQTGAISYLYYADRLNQLPLGVVGIAVGTALLPMLSKAMSGERYEEARDLFNKALIYCLLLALPAALALAAIPKTLIGGLFQRGAFEAQDTVQTSYVLMAYALGLPAYISIKVFSTVHWARQDTITPVKIAVVATLSNIVLSIILIQFMGVSGIALATGLTGWMQFILHMRHLKDHPAAVLDKNFRRSAAWIVVWSVIMAISLVLLDNYIFGGMSDLPKMVLLVAFGLCIYGAGIFFSGIFSLSSLKKLAIKK